MPRISIHGSFAKYFGGAIGTPNNTPPEQFSPGDNWLGEGVPGGGNLRDGQQTVSPTQEVVSIMKVSSPGPTVRATDSVVVCDSWDNTKLYLKKKNWEAAVYETITLGDNSKHPTGYARGVPSNGEAVWISGYNNIQRSDGLSS